MRSRLNCGEVFRAYSIVMFFLIGVPLVYSAFQSPGAMLTPIVVLDARLPFWIYMPPVWFFKFLLMPVLVFVVPYQSTHSVLAAVAAPIGFYFFWWLVWYMMYGKKRSHAPMTP